MANRLGGLRRRTRKKMTKAPGTHGNISIARYLQEFIPGDRVAIDVEPAVHKGLFDPKFQGLTGTVTRKAGRCYEVEVKDQDQKKRLVVHPAHLTRG